MKKQVALLIFIVQIFLLQFLAAQNRSVTNVTISKLPSPEKRWALIIGVNNFGLKGAVNDAKALKNTLVKYSGFPENQVILLTTDDPANPPDRRNVLIELDKLSRSVPADGLFLFAFSGHGKTIADNAYLIPSDGFFTDNDELLGEVSINVERIKKAVQRMKVKQVLMLIDACRDKIENGKKGNSSEPLTPAVTKGFSFDEANKTVEAFVTLYATRVGEFAYEFFDKDSKQWRGYFSKAVEEGLSGKAANEKGEVTLAGLVKYAEDTVPTRSYRNEGKSQTPWKNTNNGFKENELILAMTRREQTGPTPLPASISPPKSGEEAFWQTIEKSTEAEDFKQYLQEYPTGAYAATARLKLRKMGIIKVAVIMDAGQIYSTINTGDCLDWLWATPEIKRLSGTGGWGSFYPKVNDTGDIVFETTHCASSEKIVILKIGMYYVPINKKGVRILN